MIDLIIKIINFGLAMGHLINYLGKTSPIIDLDVLDLLAALD
jgi:hypothetical protein